MSEPYAELARNFRINKGFSDGTMMSGSWIDRLLAEFGQLVAPTPEMKAEAARKIVEYCVSCDNACSVEEIRSIQDSALVGVLQILHETLGK
jgi:hypothetical protein